MAGDPGAGLTLAGLVHPLETEYVAVSRYQTSEQMEAASFFCWPVEGLHARESRDKELSSDE